MARFTVITIPNWIGLIPIPATIGKRIGVRITVEEILSIKHPTTRRNRLITRRIAMGLLIPKIPFARVPGTWDIVRNLANAMEIPTRNVV